MNKAMVDVGSKDGEDRLTKLCLAKTFRAGRSLHLTSQVPRPGRVECHQGRVVLALCFAALGLFGQGA